jgi:hypothetical protein
MRTLELTDIASGSRRHHSDVCAAARFNAGMALKKAGFRGPFSVQAGPFYLRASSSGNFATLGTDALSPPLNYHDDVCDGRRLRTVERS